MSKYTKKQLDAEMTAWLEHNWSAFTPTVDAVINGTRMKLNEYECRYIQVLASECPDESWDEFCKNHRIYRKDGHLMEFQRTGRFKESFDCGFYDVSGRLNMHLIRKERGII